MANLPTIAALELTVTTHTLLRRSIRLRTGRRTVRWSDTTKFLKGHGVVPIVINTVVDIIFLPRVYPPLD